MKLDDCILDINQGVMRPPSFTAPERQWTEARDRLIIPEYLYRFYCLAEYFSIDRPPRFLDDPERKLFSFLGAVVRGMCEFFEESHRLVEQIHSDQDKASLPFNHGTVVKSHAEAVERQYRSFRYLVVNISAILDQFAEVVSILFHGDILGLTVGLAKFTVLRGFASKPFTPVGFIVSAKEARFQELHAVLVSELETTGEDQEWYELLTLYRNKLAHAGMLVFPVVALHDKQGRFYYFTPNRWPLFHQSNIRPAGSTPTAPFTLPAFVKENYVHQDIVSYSADLLARVQRMLNGGFKILCAAYSDFKNFDLNESALRSLNDKIEHPGFRSFS